MVKTEQYDCQMNHVKRMEERIVFQLDLLQDKLRYRLLADSTEVDQTEETIRDFQKSLLHCSIVHPADLNICNQILEKRTDGLAITTSEIRLYRGAAGYPRYRMYTFPANDAQGRTVFIHGVLEGIQSNIGSARRVRERAKFDSLFRKAITSNSVLSMGFDLCTGKRLISETDVVPEWLPMDGDLRRVMRTLFSQTVYPEEQSKLEAILDRNLSQGDVVTAKSFFFECRLHDLSRQTQTLHWYRVHHTYTGKAPKQPACIYLTIVDIHEIKVKEQQQIEQTKYDQMTGMLNRSAFENATTNWLQRMKNDQEYPFVCAAVLRVENTIEIHNLYGRSYLSELIGQMGKTVKAFIHPHELCCRYGLCEFAMVLAGHDREMLNERLNMLQIACAARKEDTPSVQILFGYAMEPTMQIEQADIFLEKAHQVLLGSRYAEASGYAFAVQEHQTKHTQALSVDVLQQETTHLTEHRIIIRTFGHFDVFVDGEAVLFNHPKAKELFALLVDRRGGFVSANEAISCMWEDEPSNKTTLARCRKAAMQMRQTLAQYGIDSIVETINGKRRARIDQCECDFDQYIHQSRESLPKIIGSYMNEYSWAENSIAME